MKDHSMKNDLITLNLIRNFSKFLLLFFGITASALGQSDESSQFGDFRKIDQKKFLAGFQMKGEVFILNPTGKSLVAQIPEERRWKAGTKSRKIESNWSLSANEMKPFLLHHEWELHEDNSVSGLIQQYEQGSPRGKLIREAKVSLENFAPITWIVQTSKENQVVIRFTPEMETIRDAVDLEKIKIGGDRDSFQVSDNQGYLWADGVRFGGHIIGIKSHRGAFVISLYPFQGAAEIGTAQGNSIELKVDDKLRIRIKNETDIVPGEVTAKVYGFYLPNFKMSSPNSTWSFGQGSYDKIPKEFLEAKK